ncbi:MAG: hypothetical protein IJB33_03585 [Akkermansia sp.]|nr:hypothetical protein [Akkermansia sp.]
MDIASEIAAAYRKRYEAVAEKAGTVPKIVLYRDGKVSRDVEEREYADVLYNIRIHPYYYNKKSRLLFCYDNGHVNVMTPRDLLNGKLKEKGLKSNGYKTNTEASLVKVIVCRHDDYLVMCSYGGDGKKYIKAMPLEGRSSHGDMHLAGNIFVKDARPYKWLVVPGELVYTIKPIICKTTHIGYLQELHRSLVDALLAENAAAMELKPSPIEQLER